MFSKTDMLLVVWLFLALAIPSVVFAEGSFTAIVDWVNDPAPNPADVTLTVQTRATQTGPVLDSVEMTHQGTENGFSTYKAVFLPDVNAVVWEVVLESQLKFQENPPVIVDGDDVDHSGTNELDSAFHRQMEE